jgi:hypothetical protein
MRLVVGDSIVTYAILGVASQEKVRKVKCKHCVKLTVTARRRTIAEYMALEPSKSNEINTLASLKS